MGDCHYRATTVPPNERVAGVPGPLSQLLMKLLAKTAKNATKPPQGRG